MNIFKIFIPKEKAQEVTELESWTVSWKVYINGWGVPETHNKVFIKESEANEFKKQVKESASFIKAWVDVSMYRN